jgi:hypothetical protein
MKYITLYALIMMLSKLLGTAYVWAASEDESFHPQPILSTSVLKDQSAPRFSSLEERLHKQSFPDEDFEDTTIGGGGYNGHNHIDVASLLDVTHILNGSFVIPQTPNPPQYKKPAKAAKSARANKADPSIEKAGHTVAPKSCLHTVPNDANTIKALRKISWSEPLTETDSPKPSRKDTKAIEMGTPAPSTETPRRPHQSFRRDLCNLSATTTPLGVKQAFSQGRNVGFVRSYNDPTKTKIDDAQSSCDCPPTCRMS